MTRCSTLSFTTLCVLLLTGTAFADDPGQPDTIYIGCPVYVDCPRPNLIALPVYIWADETIAGFSIGIKSRSPYVSYSHYSTAGTVLPTNWFWSTWVGTCDTLLLFGAIWFMNGANSPQGLLATLYYEVDPDAPESSVDIDSAFVPPAGNWELTGANGLATFPISPQYRDCGVEDILLLACASDADGDGIPDDTDNCPSVHNAGQQDADGDAVGDACDTCTDTDSDGFGNGGYPENTCPEDNCPTTYNPNQADTDGDGTGDSCDVCTDTDADGFGNAGFPANTCATDNCPTTYNPNQADTDGDGTGDSCDVCTDTDADGFGNAGFPENTCAADNCPSVYNPEQSDSDSDDTGDACDLCTDTDFDGFGDTGFPANTCPEDNCPAVHNPDQVDTDGDGIGDACDILCGDVDHNVLVNISDVVYLIGYIFGGGPAPNPIGSGDVDCTGIVTISDAVYLINYIFSGGPVPCAACP